MRLNLKPKQKRCAFFFRCFKYFRFQKARGFVTDDLTFYGVLGTREGGDVYFQDMEPMRLQYDIKKIFSDGNDVCVIYDITMNGKAIYSCGWYQLDGFKIKSFRVVFDPRPLLEQS